MKPEIVKVLKNLDFTEYEAKAYLALLEKSPLTGYGVALNSGVPRSKIYEVLDSMAERGDVIISYGTPLLYSPLPPKKLISRKQYEAETNLKTAHMSLEQYRVNTENRDNIWNIAGRSEILNKIREVINNAEVRILLEAWNEDAEELKAELKAASDKGVEIIILSHNEISFDFAKVYKKYIVEQMTSKEEKRWIAISSDEKEVVAGVVTLGNDSLAAWTIHPSLVIPINELIKRDIYIMEILKDHRKIIESSYGENLEKLFNRFLQH